MISQSNIIISKYKGILMEINKYYLVLVGSGKENLLGSGRLAVEHVRKRFKPSGPLMKGEHILW